MSLKLSVGGRDRVGIVTRKNFGSRPKLGSRPKIFTGRDPSSGRDPAGRDPKFFRILSNWVGFLVFSWFSRFFTLGRDPKKNSGRDPSSGHDPKKIRVATRLGSRPGVGSTDPVDNPQH